jgi:arginine exporter protein ArgO
VILSFRFPYQNPVCISLLPHTSHIPRPSHLSWSDHQNNIRWAEQITDVFVMQCLLWPVTLSLLGPDIYLSTIYLVPLGPRYLSQHHLACPSWAQISISAPFTLSLLGPDIYLSTIYLVPLGPRYLSQHHFLKRSQPI